MWSNPEPFSVWSGALATGGDVVFYGTLEGYLKAVDAKTGQELYSFKTLSGIIGNVNTWMHKGKQYVGVLSGIGGWAVSAGGRLDRGHRGSGRGRRVQGAVQLHPARRRAHGVCPAVGHLARLQLSSYCHRHLGAAASGCRSGYRPDRRDGRCPCVR